MSAPSSEAGAARWLRQLKPSFLARKKPPLSPPDPLRATGELLREAREGKGLSLRDLAQRTRISIAVLEALEGGWKDRLPEATYLRAMLPLVEHQLDLPAGSLEPVLPHVKRQPRGLGRGTDHPAAPFSPSSLHLLTTWQSALIYGLGVLGLLYAVNLQQERLAAMGRLAVKPIPLAGAETSTQEEHKDPFPELYPLQQAAKGQATALVEKESLRRGPDLSLGLLQMRLSEPTTLDLRSTRSGESQLAKLEGELSFPVLPPFELRLSPAPAPAAVRWRGQTLQGKANGDSTTVIYTVPVVATASSSAPTAPKNPP